MHEDPRRTFLSNACAEWDRRVQEKGHHWAAWDTTADSADGGVARCIGPLLEGIPLQCDWHVLDIGCGGGRLMLPVTQALTKGCTHEEEHGRVVGYDISEEMCMAATIHLAAGGCNANTHVVHGNGESLFGCRNLSPGAERYRPYQFVYSVLTFQHNPVEVWRGLVRDALELATEDAFLRVQFRGHSPDAGELLSYPVVPRVAVTAIQDARWVVTDVYHNPGPPPWDSWYWVTARHPYVAHREASA